MMFAIPVIAAEGAACLNFFTVKRSVVEGKPAPSGSFQDRQLLISQMARLLSAKAASRRFWHRGCSRLDRKLRITDAFNLEYRNSIQDCSNRAY